MTIQVEELLEKVAPLSSWCVIIRPFRGDEGMYLSGEVVDTANWRHRDSLIERRYMQYLPYGVEVPELVQQEDGTKRRMLSSLVTEPTKAERPTPSRKKQ